MISFDLASDLRWSSTRLLALDQAETMWTSDLQFSLPIPVQALAINGHRLAMGARAITLLSGKCFSSAARSKA